MTMHCPNCGKETDGKFCQFCGAPLPQADGPSETAPPAQARRKPWLPVAAAIGAAAIAAGAFVFWHNRPASVPAGPVAGQEPEPTPEATEEPLPECYIEGVSTEAYWNGIEAVSGFGEGYWKDAEKEMNDIYDEMIGNVDKPENECVDNMESVFKNAEFVKTAQQSINAITDETSGPDFEWERYIAISWLMKTEGTITKKFVGEESTTYFRGLVNWTGFTTKSELEFGNSFLVLVAASALADDENQQAACESISQWVGEPDALDALEIGVKCHDWLESINWRA